MRKLTNKAIANIFRMIADKIEAGTCEVDDMELNAIASTFIHRKLNSEQMCHHLNISRTTLTRMISDGRVPRPYKTLGGDKYWWQDEVEEHLKKHKEKYGQTNSSVASIFAV